MVELERGCNHMTCHCTAQFCYVCGSKWKSCDCPWFNHEAGEAERGNQRRIEEEVIRRLARVAAPDQDPARDPFAALGTLGAGLRNGIRRLAADVEAARPERPAPLERRRTEPLPGAALGRGPGLGLARGNGAAASRGATARPVAVTVEVQPPPPPAVHSQTQANVERYIAAVDLENSEPAVDTPFHQRAADDGEQPAPPVVVVAPRPTLRRSNTDRPARQVEYVHRSRAGTGGSGGERRRPTSMGLAGLEISGVPQPVGGGDEGVSPERRARSKGPSDAFLQRRR